MFLWLFTGIRNLLYHHHRTATITIIFMENDKFEFLFLILFKIAPRLIIGAVYKQLGEKMKVKYIGNTSEKHWKYIILGKPEVYSVAHYSLPEKYPWERSLLELVLEVKIQNGGCPIQTRIYLILIGRP